MMHFLKYEIWPVIKVRLTFWWWVVKYRGKKNIPPELIFERMAKSMARMSESLQGALRVIPPDADPEEIKELINVIRKANELENEAIKAKQE